MPIELYTVLYQPGLASPPLTVLCQAVDVCGERLLWLDGLNFEDPVVAPISAMRSIKWEGSFREFATARLQFARSVMEESGGAHSPSMLARAMLYMSRDGGLTAAAALDLATDQALDIIDADAHCTRLFTSVASSAPSGAAIAA